MLSGFAARQLIGGSNSVCKAAFDVAHEEVMDEFQTSPKIYNSKSALSCPTLLAPPRCPVYGNLDIGFDRLSRIAQPCTTPHAASTLPCAVPAIIGCELVLSI